MAEPLPGRDLLAIRGRINDPDAGHCQHPTKLDGYSLPASTCGAPAVERRTDRMFVRYVCGAHRDC